MGRPTISQYLAVANDAVRHVKSIIDIGSDTSLWSNARRGPFGAMVNKMAMDEVHQHEKSDMLSALKLGVTGRAYNLAFIESEANAARWMGAGNCGEQAALAFVYLRQRNIRPLDYVHFLTRDHAFVVVGSPIPITQTNFTDWSVDSVLCDPWRGKAEIGGMLAVRYPNTRIESLYRLE